MTTIDEKIKNLEEQVSDLTKALNQKNIQLKKLHEIVDQLQPLSNNIKTHVANCKRLGFYKDIDEDEFSASDVLKSRDSILSRYLNADRFINEPNFPYVEVDAALIDAFLRGSGANVWSGDGSSSATHIVKAVWDAFRDDAIRYKTLKEIGIINNDQLTWILLKLKKQPNAPIETLDEAIDLYVLEKQDENNCAQ